MDHTSFHGSLRGGDFDALLGVLRAWLQTDAFKIQDRLAGMEIVHEGAGISVFCQEDTPAPDRRPRYLIEGTIDAAPEAAAERLRPLLHLCRDKGIEFSLEYVPVDEDGQEIGDEVRLT